MPKGVYGDWEQWRDRVLKWGRIAVAIDDGIIPDTEDPWRTLHRDAFPDRAYVYTTRQDVAEAIRDRLADA